MAALAIKEMESEEKYLAGLDTGTDGVDQDSDTNGQTECADSGTTSEKPARQHRPPLTGPQKRKKNNRFIRLSCPPKCAEFVLNGLVSSKLQYSVNSYQEATGKTVFTASLFCQGNVYQGVGKSAQAAKNSAAERVICDLSMFAIQTGVQQQKAGEEYTPWQALTSLALGKLLENWKDGGVSLPDKLSEVLNQAQPPQDDSKTLVNPPPLPRSFPIAPSGLVPQTAFISPGACIPQAASISPPAAMLSGSGTNFQASVPSCTPSAGMDFSEDDNTFHAFKGWHGKARLRNPRRGGVQGGCGPPTMMGVPPDNLMGGFRHRGNGYGGRGGGYALPCGFLPPTANSPAVEKNPVQLVNELLGQVVFECEEEGKSPVYHIHATVEGTKYVGAGRSKKEAKRLAAMKILSARQGI